MVTRRLDELRMDELKKNFEYRVANAPIVVAKEGEQGTRLLRRALPVKGTWSEDQNLLPHTLQPTVKRTQT